MIERAEGALGNHLAMNYPSLSDMKKWEKEMEKAKQALGFFLEQFPFDPSMEGFRLLDDAHEFFFVINQEKEPFCRELQMLELFLRALSPGQKAEVSLLIVGEGSGVYASDSTQTEFLRKYLVSKAGKINLYLLLAICARDVLGNLENEIASLEGLAIEIEMRLKKESAMIC